MSVSNYVESTYPKKMLMYFGRENVKLDRPYEDYVTILTLSLTAMFNSRKKSEFEQEVREQIEYLLKKYGIDTLYKSWENILKISRTF